MNEKKKTVLLGITGGIAAYKACDIARGLMKRGYRVLPIMTEHATEFVSPLTFETLCAEPCVTELFARTAPREVEHISYAKQADLLLIAPATANVIAKLANGIADDFLTTCALACTCQKLIAPAMNTAMLQAPATVRNLRQLMEDGYSTVTPESGLLACGDIGDGKLADVDVILDHVDQLILCTKDYAGKRVLVTAGPTQEALDPVRFLTNHSSGKMGYAIAKRAALRGASVTLVSGPTALPAPRFVETVPVTSAEDMYRAVTEYAKEADVVIKAAAVADYTPESYADQKIKKSDSDLSIPLRRTKDILATLGENKREGQFLCGFSMETEQSLPRAKEKLERKNLDMIAANSLREEGAGFGVDTNRLTLITRDREEVLPLLSKEDAADVLLSRILENLS